MFCQRVWRGSGLSSRDFWSKWRLKCTTCTQRNRAPAARAQTRKKFDLHFIWVIHINRIGAWKKPGKNEAGDYRPERFLCSRIPKLVGLGFWCIYHLRQFDPAMNLHSWPNWNRTLSENSVISSRIEEKPLYSKSAFANRKKERKLTIIAEIAKTLASVCGTC